jgi:N6-adenosine-specific RNA methylase IME4
MTEYLFHPIAEIFPLLPDGELQRLAEDIRLHGLKEPVLLFESKILDGRNRALACTLAKIAPTFTTFAGSTAAEAIAHVWSTNMQRRHLTESQKAAAEVNREEVEASYAAQVRALEEAAKARQHENMPAKGQKGFQPLMVTQLIESPLASVTAVPAAPAPRESLARNARSTATQRATLAGTNRQYIADAKKIKTHAPAEFRAIQAGTKSIPQVKRELQQAEARAQLADVAIQTVKAAQGVYDVLVIDPPWPVTFNSREVRPNQVDLAYKRMTVEAIQALALPMAAECHVWLWATHRFLPEAFTCLKIWGLTYVCCFVWHKSGGMQPMGLPQFNAEFALYARKGTPQFLETTAFMTCFEAPRGEHSAKPDAFYAMVRRVTGGRRVDMFNRRMIPGFDGWGAETPAREGPHA